jgi:hypothetical protein
MTLRPKKWIPMPTSSGIIVNGMELEKHVCSLELAKRLKELGVKQESFFFWHAGPDVEPKIIIGQGYETANGFTYENFSAFSVAELGELLPMHLTDPLISLQVFKTPAGWCIRYDTGERVFWEELDPNEADARAQMLIYLLEHNLAEV